HGVVGGVAAEDRSLQGVELLPRLAERLFGLGAGEEEKNERSEDDGAAHWAAIIGVGFARDGRPRENGRDVEGRKRIYSRCVGTFRRMEGDPAHPRAESGAARDHAEENRARSSRWRLRTSNGTARKSAVGPGSRRASKGS